MPSRSYPECRSMWYSQTEAQADICALYPQQEQAACRLLLKDPSASHFLNKAEEVQGFIYSNMEAGLLAEGIAFLCALKTVKHSCQPCLLLRVRLRFILLFRALHIVFWQAVKCGLVIYVLDGEARIIVPVDMLSHHSVSEAMPLFSQRTALYLNRTEYRGNTDKPLRGRNNAFLGYHKGNKILGSIKYPAEVYLTPILCGCTCTK